MKNILLFFILLNASLLKAQPHFEPLFDQPQTVLLEPIVADLELGRGLAKAAIPIQVAPGASGWFYTVTIIPSKKRAAAGPSLISQLKSLREGIPMEEAAGYVSPKRSSRESNVYLMRGNDNATSFLNYQGCRYLREFIGTRSFSGYRPNEGQGPFFIGIENRYELKGIKVVVEAVAVFGGNR